MLHLVMSSPLFLRAFERRVLQERRMSTYKSDFRLANILSHFLTPKFSRGFLLQNKMANWLNTSLDTSRMEASQETLSLGSSFRDISWRLDDVKGVLSRVECRGDKRFEIAVDASRETILFGCPSEPKVAERPRATLYRMPSCLLECLKAFLVQSLRDEPTGIAMEAPLVHCGLVGVPSSGLMQRL